MRTQRRAQLYDELCDRIVPRQSLPHFLDQAEKLALLDHSIDVDRRLDLSEQQRVEPVQLMRGEYGWTAERLFPVRLLFFIGIPVVRAFLFQRLDQVDLLVNIDAADLVEQFFKILLSIPEAPQGRFG